MPQRVVLLNSLKASSRPRRNNEAHDSSECLSEAHNISHDSVATNKIMNIEYEKQGDSILHTESVNQDKATKKSLNENVFNEPSKLSNDCDEKINNYNP